MGASLMWCRLRLGGEEFESRMGIKNVKMCVFRTYIDVDDSRRSAAQKDNYIQQVYDIFHDKVREIKASFGENRGIVFDFTKQVG